MLIQEPTGSGQVVDNNKHLQPSIKLLSIMKSFFSLSIVIIALASCNSTDKTPSSSVLNDSLLIKIVQSDSISYYVAGKMKDSASFLKVTQQNNMNAYSNIKDAINKGYIPLLNDIEKKKYNCLSTSLTDSIYAFSSWEQRSIGLPNWLTEIEASLLLKDAEILNYQIIILKEINNPDNSKLLQKKEEELAKLQMKLKAFTKQEKWAD